MSDRHTQPGDAPKEQHRAGPGHGHRAEPDRTDKHGDTRDDTRPDHSRQRGYRDRDRDRGRQDVEDARHDRYGGANAGAAFFGWLVAIALSILLISIIGAIAAAVGETLDVSRADADDNARAYGLGAGIALFVVLFIGYFAGGYVAGRMSRYDGGRQGFAVWVIGLVVTVIAAVIGVVFGREYDVIERVDLPSVPIPDDTLTTSGIITLVAVVIGTALAAVFGGKAGHRYHDKVDRFTG
jgi:hypothetical protein